MKLDEFVLKMFPVSLGAPPTPEPNAAYAYSFTFGPGGDLAFQGKV